MNASASDHSYQTASDSHTASESDSHHDADSRSAATATQYSYRNVPPQHSTVIT